ncbi:DJ-1 family glyoxalase III [Tumidithrix helvetica PCC 7403]|uniref:DJ-1 family glyoxalase III n=1 Tax=Tumidithrix helvetica TaxID=3457545 RepID=UPI003C8DBC99
MPTALVPLAEGFEEIEAITIIDVLRRGGVEVLTVGLESVVVEGAHNITLMADRLLEYADPNDFDAIVLPGGPGTYKLKADPRIIDMLQKQSAARKYTAAVCAAPVILSEAGLLKGKRATSFPSVQGDLEVGEYLAVPVVVDGLVITSRGPGTVMAFALKLVELLQGEAIATKLASDMQVS